jgi:uncharacterized protein (DUF1810 family)
MGTIEFMMDDDIERFVVAQEPVYDAVLDELRAGRKRTHWMWFVFPQLRGLGSSRMAHAYGIASLDEARAYLRHPVLGPRLVACTELVLAVNDRPLHEIFGSPDDAKFHSSMSLFAAAAANSGEQIFTRALERYFGGAPDERTRALFDAPRP